MQSRQGWRELPDARTVLVALGIALALMLTFTLLPVAPPTPASGLRGGGVLVLYLPMDAAGQREAIGVDVNAGSTTYIVRRVPMTKASGPPDWERVLILGRGQHTELDTWRTSWCRTSIATQPVADAERVYDLAFRCPGEARIRQYLLTEADLPQALQQLIVLTAAPPQ